MIEPGQRPNVVDVRDGLLHRQVVDADAENSAVAAQCTGNIIQRRELGIVSCGCPGEGGWKYCGSFPAHVVDFKVLFRKSLIPCAPPPLQPLISFIETSFSNGIEFVNTRRKSFPFSHRTRTLLNQVKTH